MVNESICLLCGNEVKTKGMFAVKMMKDRKYAVPYEDKVLIEIGKIVPEGYLCKECNKELGSMSYVTYHNESAKKFSFSWPNLRKKAMNCKYLEVNGYIRKHIQTYNEMAGLYGLEYFYSECYAKGVSDLNNEENKRKATVIFNRVKEENSKRNSELLYVTNADDLELCFAESKEEFDFLIFYEEEIKKQAALIEAAKELGKNLAYAQLEGQAKDVAMIEDHISEQAMQLDNKPNYQRYLNATMYREHSWAIMGGIADGIAGPGAGLMVALNVAQKNAEIRARNQVLIDTAAQVSLKMAEKRYEIESLIKYYEERKEEAELSEVDFSLDINRLFRELSFEKVKCVSDSYGIIRISGDVMCNELTSSSGKRAFVNGSIKAEVYNEGYKIGETLIALPTTGYRYVSGIIIEGGIENAEYELRFSPYKLWLQEGY